MSALVDWAKVAKVARGIRRAQPWDAECATSLEAAAKLCEAMPLIEALLALIEAGNEFDGIDHVAKRLREALK